MSWRKAVEVVMLGWPAHQKARAMTELQDDNDHAERLGFTCHPDDRLGFGRCYFTKDNARVWESPDGWARADVTAVVGQFKNYRYYHTLGQALDGSQARAFRTQFGQLEVITAAKE